MAQDAERLGIIQNQVAATLSDEIEIAGNGRKMATARAESVGYYYRFQSLRFIML
jgi:hypothetical protein